MSCVGLSIIFNTDKIVCTSILSKNSDEVSLNTGIFNALISFSYIGAKVDVALNKITISLYVIFLYPIFLSYTT